MKTGVKTGVKTGREGAGGSEKMNKDRAMIIKWNDAYPIESSRLKSMAIHVVHLLPSTCATSVDASLGK